MNKHRGEPEFQIFELGDLVQFKPTSRFTPKHTFVIIAGGYMTYGEWIPVVTEVPLDTRTMVKVGHLD